MKELFEYLISKENKSRVITVKNKVDKDFFFIDGDIVEVPMISGSSKIEYFIFCSTGNIPNMYSSKSNNRYGMFVRFNTNSSLGYWNVREGDYDENLNYINKDAVNPSSLSPIRVWRTGIDPVGNWKKETIIEFLNKKYLIFERR